MEKTFRCPFEEKGREEGTIIDIVLGSNKQSRLKAMASVFMQFHSRKESPAIRFILPKSVLVGCVSLAQLKFAVLPFQAEVLAAELDFRLRPFLSYQLLMYAKDYTFKIAKSDPGRYVAALALARYFKETRIPRPRDMEQISVWLEAEFEHYIKQGVKNPQMKFLEPVGDKQLHPLTLQPAALTLHAEHEDPANPESNKNCFAIVKSPFYPKAFGRYSEGVEIVVSREADFAGLSSEMRKRIRVLSNTVYRDHGVLIENLENDKQVTGVWEPVYVR